MKKFAPFLKTIFVTALVAFPAQGYAAQLEVPQSPWTISQIAAASTSGVNYCSMKTGFSGHYELVFARDAAGYNSIALDSGKDRFMTGAQYPLRLSALGVTREKVFVAVTPRVLITQMGLDEEFFDSLSQAPLISIVGGAINGGFSMDGATTALAKLEECANTAALGKKFSALSVPLTPALQEQPMQVSSAPVMPVETVGIDQESANLQVELLQSQMAELRAQNQKIMALLSEAKSPPKTAPVVIQKVPQPRPVIQAAEIEPAAGDVKGESDSMISATYDLPSDIGQQGLLKMADNYLSALSDRCKGDFAFKSRVLELGSAPVAAEVACVGNTGGQDMTAALLFYTKDGHAFVRVNEAELKDAKKAIEERDVFAVTLR